jgi:hypothetical protein
MRAADRPVAAIFHFNSMPNGVSVHTPVLVGRRLTQVVGPLFVLPYWCDSQFMVHYSYRPFALTIKTTDCHMKIRDTNDRQMTPENTRVQPEVILIGK